MRSRLMQLIVNFPLHIGNLMVEMGFFMRRHKLLSDGCEHLLELLGFERVFFEEFAEFRLPITH
jgi:hypothetical protein